jgi:PKD repeat protein
VSAAHTFADNGVYTVKLVSRDPAGATGVDSVKVTISNLAPAIRAVTTPSAPTARGAQVSASVSFSDAGTADTHTATISWGDGTTSEVNAGSATEASATHAYGAAGFYTVIVTVRDDDGGATQAQSPTTVTVFDPAAGRLSGAGRIEKGRDGVGFGFDVGYGRSGKLEGRFGIISRDLVVESESLEYLVVSGAQGTFRGAGRLRDGTPVGFFVSGRDGRVARERDDKVRIKVWSLATNAVLYDTEPGVAELAPPATVVSGGQVMLRR